MLLTSSMSSGKSTHLDVLAGRKTVGETKGTIHFGGQKPTRAFLKRFTGKFSIIWAQIFLAILLLSLQRCQAQATDVARHKFWVVYDTCRWNLSEEAHSCMCWKNTWHPECMSGNMHLQRICVCIFRTRLVVDILIQNFLRWRSCTHNPTWILLLVKWTVLWEYNFWSNNTRHCMRATWPSDVAIGCIAFHDSAKDSWFAFRYDFSHHQYKICVRGDQLKIVESWGQLPHSRACCTYSLFSLIFYPFVQITDIFHPTHTIVQVTQPYYHS